MSYLGRAVSTVVAKAYEPGPLLSNVMKGRWAFPHAGGGRRSTTGSSPTFPCPGPLPEQPQVLRLRAHLDASVASRSSPEHRRGSSATRRGTHESEQLPSRLRSPIARCGGYGQRRPRSSVRMQYNSQCATRRRCPSCMRPALLRACARSFCTCAASRFAPCLAAACERYLEWRRPQTLTCHQAARLSTSILILIAELLSVRRRRPSARPWPTQ
jgi:hypothetical protein